jgi:hypothetical protein
MDLYNVSITAVSRWGTQPQFTGHGLNALDLMEVLSTPQDDEQSAVTDAAGKPVALGDIINAARAEVTTPEALEYWVSHAAWVVIDKLGALHVGPNHEITEDDWQRAGQWWAEHVSEGAPEPAVLAQVRGLLSPRDPAELDRGTRQLIVAATSPRLSGDLLVDTPARPPGPSRMRGAAAGSASLPGGRPNVGGAGAGQAHLPTNGGSRSRL